MALSGDLTEFHLQELLQILAMSRKSGTLAVNGETAEGTLQLEGGRLVDATAGGLSGEAAFFFLMRNRQGLFVFSPSDRAATPVRPTIRRNLSLLLMEATGLPATGVAEAAAGAGTEVDTVPDAEGGG